MRAEKGKYKRDTHIPYFVSAEEMESFSVEHEVLFAVKEISSASRNLTVRRISF